MKILLLSLLLIKCLWMAQGFIGAPHPHGQREKIGYNRKHSLHASSSSSEDNNNNNNNNNNDNDSLWKSLRQRVVELQSTTRQRRTAWQGATCETAVSLVLPGGAWVRRLDMGTYPYVACGSAPAGDVFVGNLATGAVVAVGRVGGDGSDYTSNIIDTDHEESEFELAQRTERLARTLYHGYDGGGTLAIAFAGTLICEARRSGGVYLWRLDEQAAAASTNEKASPSALVPQGSIPALDGQWATALHLDDDYLWVGTAHGKVQAYALQDDHHPPLALQTTPTLERTLGGNETIITSLALHNAYGVGAAATSAGSVDLFAVEEAGDASQDDQPTLGSFFPPFDSPERKSMHAFPSSVEFVEVNHDNDDDDTQKELLVAAGGNNGDIFLQPLELTTAGEIDATRPFQKPLRPLRPRHFGACQCLCSPLPGILISGGQDGGIRCWEIQGDGPNKNGSPLTNNNNACLYQFVGYKVWLGSLITDGDRLISDGADNTVVVHDFSK